jgi:hypothetical protein
LAESWRDVAVEVGLVQRARRVAPDTGSAIFENTGSASSPACSMSTLHPGSAAVPVLYIFTSTSKLSPCGTSPKK